LAPQLKNPKAKLTLNWIKEVAYFAYLCRQRKREPERRLTEVRIQRGCHFQEEDEVLFGTRIGRKF
jgi:hypothetical protein